jgi:hypothetical protein
MDQMTRPAASSRRRWEHPPDGARARRRVLFVGAERPDEFADAVRVAGRGHQVMVINPRQTLAATRFLDAGGTFVRARIEQLPPGCCRFDIIYENYPYPSGRNYVPPRPFVLRRLARLAPRGRWILFTESARLASLLKAVGDHDVPVQRRYRVTLSSVPIGGAPPSHYPPTASRYRLQFERRG